ncbi:DUF892 family protein, partial [Candidatus Roizmanbacteria bacterium]|nr:DUF892 family protein [Candidatus Roizmanbacteria bacterium]
VSAHKKVTKTYQFRRDNVTFHFLPHPRWPFELAFPILQQRVLQLLHSMESQLISTLPLMVNAAADVQLKRTLNEHLLITQEQTQRLEEVGKSRGLTLTDVNDQGLTYLLKDAQTHLQEASDSHVRDMIVRSSVLKVEYYEIGAYESAIELAQKLKENRVVESLQKTLKEERQAADNVRETTGGGFFGKMQAGIAKKLV